MPLDIEECRTALWLCRGNVSEAAARLKVPSSRLRTFIRNSKYLTDEAKEAQERLVDLAENVAYEALVDASDKSRQDRMAVHIMNTIGRGRGYGQNGAVNLNLPKGPMKISWDDGSSLSMKPDNGNVIEGEVVNE